MQYSVTLQRGPLPPKTWIDDPSRARQRYAALIDLHRGGLAGFGFDEETGEFLVDASPYYASRAT